MHPFYEAGTRISAVDSLAACHILRHRWNRQGPSQKNCSHKETDMYSSYCQPNNQCETNGPPAGSWELGAGREECLLCLMREGREARLLKSTGSRGHLMQALMVSGAFSGRGLAKGQRWAWRPTDTWRGALKGFGFVTAWGSGNGVWTDCLGKHLEGQ